jgi:hypothetical protein
VKTPLFTCEEGAADVAGFEVPFWAVTAVVNATIIPAAIRIRFIAFMLFVFWVALFDIIEEA